MTPDAVYRYALSVTLAEEGGFVDHPADPGGRTMRGVTQRRYDTYRQGQGLTPQDVLLISEEELQSIYRSYWDEIGAELFDPPLAVVAFDSAVNAGSGRVLGWLAEEPHNYVSLSVRRLQHYTDLEESWKSFGRGWARRTARVLRAAQKLA